MKYIRPDEGTLDFTLMDLSGSAFIKVITAKTQVNATGALSLEVLAMSVQSTPILHFRKLGEETWVDIELSHIAQSVYEVTIPSQEDDFEYYIESNELVFHVTAPYIYHTVVVNDCE